MSYILSRHALAMAAARAASRPLIARASSRPRPPRKVMALPLSGFLSDAYDYIANSGANALEDIVPSGYLNSLSDRGLSCLDQANASPLVAQLDAQLAALEANWHPTGFYNPSDVNAIVSQVVQQLQAAKVLVLTAPASVSDQVEVRMQATTDIDKMYADSARFTQAAQQAAATGQTVSAPDLKDYVTKGLMVASNGYVTAAALACNVAWLQQVNDALQAVGAVIVKIVGVAVTAAETVVDVAASTFETADAIAKYSGPVLLGVGALALYFLVIKPRLS